MCKSDLVKLPTQWKSTAYWANLFPSYHCYVEFEETTWHNKDIMCMDITFNFPHEFVTEGKLGKIVVPFIDFSLIVDPNDPLFEDEIKASSIFTGRTKLWRRLCFYSCLWFC